MSGRARTFTLIEIMLATTLTAVVGLAVASVVTTLHGARERVNARAARRALLSSLERRIVEDLRALVPPGGLHAAGLVGESAVGGGGTSVESLLPADLEDAALETKTVVGDPAPLEARDRLTLAAWPAARAFGQTTPLGEGALWQIVYEVDDDPLTPERGLLRRVMRVRDPAEGSAPEPAEELAREVVAMDLAFYDGTGWVETWDSGASDTLPQAVRLDLVIAHAGEVLVYRIIVSSPTSRPTQLREATGEAASEGTQGSQGGQQPQGGGAAPRPPAGPPAGGDE